MVWDYSDKTKELFMEATQGGKNSHVGEIKNSDGEGFHGSLVCGDAIKLTFNVKKSKENPEKDIITEVKYLTFGCTSAIATSEALCIILERDEMTPIKALSLTKQTLVDFLDGLPNQKIHCSVMGIEALDLAIEDWAKKRSVDLSKHGYKPVNHEEDTSAQTEIVCKCMNLTREYISDQIRDLGLKTVEEVVEKTGAGSVCGTCIEKEGGIRDILENKDKKQEVENKDNKTPYQLAKEIENVLNNDIIPVLGNDGGGLEIIDIRDNTLYFSLKGACVSCASANNTIEYTIKKTLHDKVSPEIKVKRV